MGRLALFMAGVCTFGGCASTAPASAQAGAPSAAPATNVPVPLYTTLGPHSRDITTASTEAREYFRQGMQFMYAFTPSDAVESFRAAQRLDPECAMCYWGEAWAWGPYLNGRMSDDDAPRAHAAVQAARARSGGVSEVERALIEAMGVRYEPVHDPARRVQLDSAYAQAMARVFERFPEDPEVGTLYGESLMLLLPRRGTWDLGSADVQRVHRTLEHVLEGDIRHPGACHLYVHATESTVAPGKAERCAEYLGNAIPGASHINHMPSHTYNRIGRWGDAVRANIQAWHSDQRAEWGEGFAIYPSHNLHMLLFAASMDGQGAIAIQAAKDYARIQDGGVFYRVLALVRFGRFDEVLSLDAPPPAHPAFRGFVEYGRGYAHLRSGAPDSARAHLARVRAIAVEPSEASPFRGHPTEDLLGVVAGVLEGEILAEEGRTDEAVRALREAVRIEDALRYDEPEPLNMSARHYLGAVLLEAGRAEEAIPVYEAALDDHPRNGWSLFGLERALRASGRTLRADAVRREFEAAWARADVWLRSSRF